MLTAFTRLLVTGAVLASASSGALACGWWGDGESGSGPEAIVIGPDGKPIGRAPGAEAIRREMKIPDERGFGLAIFVADEAVPYRRAVGGRKINRLATLKDMGYSTVIDIGTPAPAASLHQAETKSLGMRYVHIPLDDKGIPAPEGIDLFRRTVLAPANRPLLVFAENIDTLASTWALHRLRQGVPWAVVEEEATNLGISDNALSVLPPPSK